MTPPIYRSIRTIRIEILLAASGGRRIREADADFTSQPPFRRAREAAPFRHCLARGPRPNLGITRSARILREG